MKLNVSKRSRNDSGIDEDLSSTPDVSVVQWEDAVRRWSDQVHSVVEQESTRMRQMTDGKKMELHNNQGDETKRIKIAEEWKEKMRDIMILTQDLMECISNDILEGFDSEFSGSSSSDCGQLENIPEEEACQEKKKRRKSGGGANGSTSGTEHIFLIKHHRVSSSNNRHNEVKKILKALFSSKMSKAELNGEWDAVTVKIDRLKKKEVFRHWMTDEIKSKKQRTIEKKNISDQKKKEREEEEFDIFADWRKWNLVNPIKWSDGESEVDEFREDVEAEDIFYDWIKMNRRRYGRHQSSSDNDVNNIFWDISLDEKFHGIRRRLSEEILDLPIGDQPDIIHDRCEFLEGRALCPKLDRRPKMYWNIFKSWRHNLAEPSLKKRKRILANQSMMMMKKKMKLDRPPAANNQTAVKNGNRIFVHSNNSSWYHFPKKYPMAPSMRVTSPQRLTVLKTPRRRRCFSESVVVRPKEVEDYFNDWRFNFRTANENESENIFQDWVDNFGKKTRTSVRRKSFGDYPQVDHLHNQYHPAFKKPRFESEYLDAWKFVIEETDNTFHKLTINMADKIKEAFEKYESNLKASRRKASNLGGGGGDEFQEIPDNWARVYRNSRQEFCQLRYAVRTQRQRRRSFNNIIDSEDWFSDWRWNFDPVIVELKKDDMRVEKIFHDWRHNLKEQEEDDYEVETIFSDFASFLQEKEPPAPAAAVVVAVASEYKIQPTPSLTTIYEYYYSIPKYRFSHYNCYLPLEHTTRASAGNGNGGGGGGGSHHHKLAKKSASAIAFAAKKGVSFPISVPPASTLAPIINKFVANRRRDEKSYHKKMMKCYAKQPSPRGHHPKRAP